MKKLLTLLCTLMMVMSVKAQTTLRGIVADADNGEPLIGATIRVLDTPLTAVTDIDGRFVINDVPAEAKLLQVGYVGMKTQTLRITDYKGTTILLQSDNLISEVVVTAMGISREKKALGYAMSEVKGDEMTKARGGLNNPVNALQGKVAGLQISSNSGSIGGSSKVLIRGVSSISGNNQPLFVINGVPVEGSGFDMASTGSGNGGYDYGNLVQDINPDDIESVSVLKGASASALYGSRANNGVILITTKRGSKDEGMEISYSGTVGMEHVGKLPEFQNLYGGGNSPTFSTATINGKTYNIPAYNVDASWGPKFEGQEVLSWYDMALWEDGGKQGTPTTSKWLPAKHDYDSFFETGLTVSNNISIANTAESSQYRLSYTNTEAKGIIPNSGQHKNAINISGTLKSKDKRLEVFTNVSYLNTRTNGRMETGTGENNICYKVTSWWQRQLDFKELKEMYISPSGSQHTWNRTSFDNPTPLYTNNPYWSIYMNNENDSRNRIYGNVGASFQVTPWLKAQYKVNLDFFSQKEFEHSAVGSKENSSYSENARQQYEVNHEWMLMGHHNFGDDFSLQANLGANIMHRHYELTSGSTQGGLAIPLLYNLSNSVQTPKASNEVSRRSMNSFFGNVSLGWRSMVFLEATLRRDCSSTLPKDNNTYWYPSFTTSFIFSELLRSQLPWLSYGKLRAGWAKVGSDTSPYSLVTSYTQYTNIGNGVPGYILSERLNTSNLKPETTYSWEVGLELSFLNNRIGLDITYYNSESRDQIVPFSVSSTTGYTSAVLNAGVLSNKGFELTLHATPVQNRNFEWNTTLTLSQNRNRVENLTNGVEYYRIASGAFNAELGAYVGDRYGVIMGTNYVYDSEGRRMVDPETGLYQISNGYEKLGYAYPDFTGGWNNSFSIGRFDASIQFDFQKGGHYFSATYQNGIYSGLLAETVENGIRENGIVLEGVIDDKGTPNTKAVDAQTWAYQYYNGPAAMSVLRSDYVKLREITVGYHVPLRCRFIKDLRLSAYARNLAVWGPDTRHYDPENIVNNSGNVQGLDYGHVPSSRNYGFTVNLKF